MEKFVYLNDLYDYYKDIFTEKQRYYFEKYYHENLSLSEIAQNDDISRNAVHNQLKIVEAKLEELENILKLYEKKNKIVNLLKNKVDNETLNNIEKLL